MRKGYLNPVLWLGLGFYTSGVTREKQGFVVVYKGCVVGVFKGCGFYGIWYNTCCRMLGT